MQIDTTVTRRAALATGAGAGLAMLAACSAGSGGGAPKSQAAGKKLIALTDLPVGESREVTLPDGSPAVVARPAAGTVVCFSAICTHQGCTVRPNGKELDCPCHGSVFDAFTGKVLQTPAPSPLPAVPVTVQGGQVVTT